MDSDQAERLVSVKENHPTLKTLCGIVEGTSELDVSNRNLSTADAVLLAAEFPENEAVTSLDLSATRIGSRLEIGDKVS
jgi:hypothetical protein